MRHLTPEDYLDMPWKDGGGVTTQLIVRPEGATVAGGFDWRLSRARVAAGGPFSCFDGYDRHLVLLEGEGFILHFEDRIHRMDRPLLPLAFPGEAKVQAELLGGPCTDFNLIARRERWRSELILLQDTGPLPPAPVRALHALSPLQIGATTLAAGDTLVLEGDESPRAFLGPAPRALLARLWPRRA
jgi:hypothetical protein